MSMTTRLLGLAFASADALIEIDLAEDRSVMLAARLAAWLHAQVEGGDEPAALAVFLAQPLLDGDLDVIEPDRAGVAGVDPHLPLDRGGREPLHPALEQEGGDATVAERPVHGREDEEVVGQVAANIREIRKPEPYKGKGVRYVNERVLRKAGKTGKK